jgi:hypothetical protein
MAFPPSPVYPKAIDSDYTLYQVYNTTETKLAADNSAWSLEMEIVPVTHDRPDIWADNGFGNIEGELFYYDSVERNEHGRVNKLKGCARQLGGEKTKFNKRGTWVRSFVVAEHHNQLVNCILKMQDFVGYDFDPRQKTLDWRIRNLRALDVIFDDYSCPDIDFTFNIVEDDPVKGILAQYFVAITPPGSVSSFRLDFGDGLFTTTDLQGEHRYALNSRVDPVIRVSNDKCQIVQTPIERTNPAEPPSEVENEFTFPIPEIPDVPDFTFVPCDIPEPDINLPALVMPCISIEGQIGPIPSIITGPTINLVSQVIITGPTSPVNITQSVVQIIGGDNIPNLIIIDPPIPPTIIIDPPIPPTIVIIPPNSNITLDFDFAELPRLEVDWGTPPDMEVALTLSKQVQTPQRFAADPSLLNEFGEEFADLFDVSHTMKVEYEPAGIPSEIRVIAPDMKDLKVDYGDLFSRKIKIDSSDVNIPSGIRIYGPETPIPNSIRLDGSELPHDINLIYRGGAIPVEVIGMPKTVTVEMEKTIPDRIVVEMPEPIPHKIVVEHNIPTEIIIKGPDAIPIIVPDGLALPIKFPDELPKFEVVYKGAPIELKISMDEVMDKEADGSNCVMITKCPIRSK